MKTLRNVVICFIIVFVSIAFCACDVDYKKYAGEYVLTSITFNGGKTYNSIEEMTADGIKLNNDPETITLGADKKFSFSGVIGSATGAYSIDGDAIIFNLSSGGVVAEIVNKKVITITSDNKTFVFTKGGK